MTPEIPGYTDLRHLGSGGFGDVYHARSAAHGEVAIKVLHKDTDPEDKARFLDEARVLQEIRSPSIPAFHELLELPTGPALVMEYVPGRNLYAHLEDCEGLPERLALIQKVLPGVIDALLAMHELGIVHRDLKPENIQVRPDTKTGVLLDLGIAKSTTTQVRTATGIITGTPGYLAPEQLLGDREAARAPSVDLYQLAMVIVRALDGSYATEEASDPQAAFQRAMGKVDPNKDLSRLEAPALAGLLPVLRECLSSPPSDRPSTKSGLKQLRNRMSGNASGIPSQGDEPAFLPQSTGSRRAKENEASDGTSAEGPEQSEGPKPKGRLTNSKSSGAFSAPKGPPTKGLPSEHVSVSALPACNSSRASAQLTPAGSSSRWTVALGTTLLVAIALTPFAASPTAPRPSPVTYELSADATRLHRIFSGDETRTSLPPVIEVSPAQLPGAIIHQGKLGGYPLTVLQPVLASNLTIGFDRSPYLRFPSESGLSVTASLLRGGEERKLPVSHHSGGASRIWLHHLPLPEDRVIISLSGVKSAISKSSVDFDELVKALLNDLPIDVPELKSIQGSFPIDNGSGGKILGNYPPWGQPLESLVSERASEFRGLLAVGVAHLEEVYHLAQDLADLRFLEWTWDAHWQDSNHYASSILNGELDLSVHPNLTPNLESEALFIEIVQPDLHLGIDAGIRELTTGEPSASESQDRSVRFSEAPEGEISGASLGIAITGGEPWVNLIATLPTGREVSFPGVNLGNTWLYHRIPPSWLCAQRNCSGPIEVKFRVDDRPGMSNPGNLHIFSVELRLTHGP